MHELPTENKPESVSDRDPRLSHLLLAWERLRQLGEEVALEELCHDCPDLVEPLRRETEHLGTLPTLPAGPAPPILPAVAGYEVLAELGRGGMGVVYKARQIKLNRVVALKMLLSGPLAAAAEIRRFHQEAEAVARLQHPNIVQVYDTGECAGRAYFAMENVEGGSLADRLRSEPVPFEEAARLVLPLARAMQHAHDRGIVHRDLKPTNVLFTATGEPKITDFGLAKLLDQEGKTRTGDLMGTPGYMSPEQAAGKSRDVEPATDIWALGAILYKALTGSPPFRGATVEEVLVQLLRDDPVAPSRLRRGLPHDLGTICLKCLRRDPRSRFGSAGELADDLERYLRGEPIRARPVGRAVRLWRWARRHRTVAGLLAAVAMLLTSLLVGTAVAAVLLGVERNAAVKAESEAREAVREGERRLYRTYLAQAQAGRSSGRLGQRLLGLEALTEAARLRPQLDAEDQDPVPLRSETTACLALVDLRLDRRWPGYPMSGDHGEIAFDADLGVYARLDEMDNLVIRRMEDNGLEKQVARLEGIRGRPVLRFSADGKHLAAIYLQQTLLGTFPAVQVWDRQSGESRFRIAARWPAVDFSPNGQMLAYVRRDGAISCVAVPSGREVKRIASSTAPAYVRFDPTGKRLAISRGNRVEVIRLDDGQVAQSLEGLPTPDMVAWSADGSRLAGCNGGQNRAVVWEVSQRCLRMDLRGHEGGVVHVAFHPSGMLATSSWDGTKRLWEPGTGQPLLVTEGSATKFSRDGRWLGWGRQGYVIGRWRVDTSPECRPLPTVGGQTFASTFSATGRLLAVGGRDGVEVWDTALAKPVAFLDVGESRGVLFHPAEPYLVASTPRGLLRWRVDADISSVTISGDPEVLLAPGESRLGRICSDQRGHLLAVVQELTGAVRLVPWRAGERPTGAGRLRNASFAALSPDGRWLAAGAYNGDRVMVWDTRSSKLAWKRLVRGVARVAFSADGNTLVVSAAGEHRFIRVGLWDELDHAPIGGELASPGLAYSPDGKLLAVAETNGAISLRDASTRHELTRLIPTSRRATSSISFSLAGDWLATSTDGAVVHLWDLRRVRARFAEMSLDW